MSLMKRQACLALCIALKDSIPKSLKNTRIGGLTKRIAKIANKELDYTGMSIDIPRARKVVAKLGEFEKSAGWGHGKEKHIGTYINTLLEILERTNHQKIKDLLVEIVDFYERDGRKIPGACYWAAELNGSKWDKCFD